MSSDNLAEPFSVSRCIAAVKVAEREGFEPPVGFYTYGALAKRCFRPLSHLSGLKTEAKKQRRTTQSARSFIRPLLGGASRR